MWHTLPFVAESRRIDAKELAAFAMANQDRYGIVTDRGEPEVNTWHVDKLVADFKGAPRCTDCRWPVLHDGIHCEQCSQAPAPVNH